MSKLNKNYIDCHSHILFSIDDGARTIENSIEILKKMQELGFKEIILTPHYRRNFTADNYHKMELLKELEQKKIEEDINIKLYLANEVFVTTNLLELIQNKKIQLFNDYIFLELPFHNAILNLDKIIYELQANNYKIIIVHPERYSYFTLEDVKRLREDDILFQVNYESIIGKYGNNAKKFVKQLYKNHLVDFVASDVHNTSTIMFKRFKCIEKRIKSIVKEDEYKKLTYDNMKKIIDGCQ